MKKNYLIKIIKLLPNSFRKKAFILIFLLIFGIIIEMISVTIMIPLFSILNDIGFVKKSSIINFFYTYIASSSYQQLILFSLVLIILIYLLKTIFLLYSSFYQVKFSTNFSSFLTQKLFSKYLKKEYDFHLSNNSSRLIRNVTVETNLFAIIMQNILILLTEFSVGFGLLLLLFIFSPLNSLLIILLFSSFAFIFHFFTKMKILEWGKKRQELDGIINKHIHQGLGGIKEVKIMSKESFFIKHYVEIVENRAKYLQKNTLLQSTPRLFLEFITILGLTVLILIQLLIYKKNDMLPVLALFGASAFRLIPSINRIMGSLQMIKFNQPVIDLLFKELKEPEKKIEISNKHIDFYNKIEFKNVSFRYEKNLPCVLENINIEFKKNTIIGIIGSSGSGKSTLIDLLSGLLKPTEGSVMCDNFDINFFTTSWRSKIGYVPQFIYLLDDSIRNNIAFGIDQELIDDVKVNTAINFSELDLFVNQLPKGVETIVGERGAKISGGQRQRIGIARALYHMPEILIFDESTSALDQDTEISIMNSIYKLSLNKTIFIITHKASTLKNCNQIYKIENKNLIKI